MSVHIFLKQLYSGIIEIQENCIYKTVKTITITKVTVISITPRSFLVFYSLLDPSTSLHNPFHWSNWTKYWLCQLQCHPEPCLQNGTNCNCPASSRTMEINNVNKLNSMYIKCLTESLAHRRALKSFLPEVICNTHIYLS